MVNYHDRDYSGVYALNSYLRRLLEVNMGWTDYGNLDTVIPVAQQPELMQSGKPFIVYGSAVNNPGHLYVVRNEAVAYNIFSTSSTEANAVATLMARVFERQDDAAADVNEWIGTEIRTPKRKVSFQSIQLSMVQRAEAAEEEGGFVSALVMLKLQYINTDPQPIVTQLTAS